MISSLQHIRKSAVILPALAMFAFPAATAVPAQPYRWTTVEIGGGGFVTGTIFHPTERGLVYARTDVGGAYRLDPSTLRWIALNDEIGGLNNEMQHLGVMSLALDPIGALMAAIVQFDCQGRLECLRIAEDEVDVFGMDAVLP